MNYAIRPLKKTELDCLDEFLYLAIFVPAGVPAPPREITKEPELTIYIRDFGTLPADRCLAAITDGSTADDREKIIAVVWARIINDYGHIDDDTPSLSISVRPDYRGRGVGTALMGAMIERLREDGFRYASLSVQKRNVAAVQLYRKLGFETVRENGEEYIMSITL